MPITPSQLTSILRVKKEFNTITGDITLTDLTDWSGYGIIAPDTAAVLLKLVSPTGSTVYINSGYDTNDFSSPDFDLSTSVLNETMPLTVTGDYLTGTYTLYIKAQVEDDGDTVDSSEKTSASVVCDCTATVSIDIEVDYATELLTSTDTTNYGAYYSLTRTHTIYPPPISGLPNQTTNATTNVYSNIVTTTWSVEISSDVVYLKANDTYTTCRFTGSKEAIVEADTLCTTLCLLKKFRTDLYSKFGKKCVEDMEAAYTLAMDEFLMAMMATRCGRPQSEVQTYINKIYEITGLDPNCDCGCEANDYPTPVVPTSIINGTDGTDGVTPEFQNTGTWIQVSYDSGSTWNNLFSLASVTGAAGAAGTNGTDGADGVAVLENVYPAAVTTGTAWETLETYQLPAAQMSANGDMINIKARLKAVGTIQNQEWRIQFDGNTVAFGFFNDGIAMATADIWLSRTSNTEAKYDVLQTGNINFLGLFYMVSVGGGYGAIVNSVLTTLAGLNFTTTAYDITVDGNSVVAGDVMCEKLQVIYYKKQ
jgi:hypothetical protein